mmetsp:Transcript_4700/g.14192  ORF Transcript_4700/g.14192 Transcript_4700/m.14192 type:complete len:349 (+) Transcript_4700:119-1165(+)
MASTAFVSHAINVTPAKRLQTGQARLRWRTARVKMTVSEPSGGEVPRSTGFWGLLRAINKFTRPHTIRGTILGAFAGCSRALLENRGMIDWGLVPTALLGVVALLLGNAYIVGINQIYDVNIDKVNKPFLPLAAGEMSSRLAWIVVFAALVGGLAIVYQFYSPLIFKLYAFGLGLGTVYSVPPFHLKRFPIIAALIISTVRGFLLNFGVYHATCAALKVPFTWNVPITFIATFMTVFAIVIALSKDIPDIKGDQSYQVKTFATRLGPAKMVKVVTSILSLNYLMAIAVAARFSHVLRSSFMLPAHAALLVALQLRSRSVNPESIDSVKKFYAFIWLLFYTEYLMFPFF